MRSFKFKVNGNEYNADIKAVQDSQLTIEINGVSYDVDIEKKEKKTPILSVSKVLSSSIETNKKTSKPGDVQPNSIKAPIPGTILKINYNVGDTVKLGDTVIILEAMKMLNNIVSEINGIIAEVLVSPGDEVGVGDPLISVEKRA